MGLEQRDRIRLSYGRNNWKQEDDDAYDGQTVQDHQEASVRGGIRRSNPIMVRLVPDEPSDAKVSRSDL